MNRITSLCKANIAKAESGSVLHNKPNNQNGVIQVWVMPYTVLRKYRALPQLLSTNERIRASRLKGTKKARDYILTRVFLRSTLASQMNCMPLDVDIQYPMNAKPFVIDGPAFNLSHCEQLLVVAVADAEFTGQIGVDVEARVTDPGYLRLANKCFTQSERNQLTTYKPGISRQNAFTRGWTRKEAVVKTIGSGLQVPLNCFDVSLKVAERYEQSERGMARQSMLLGSQLKDVPIRECELYDLGSFLDCEISLAVINKAVVDSVVCSSVVQLQEVDEHQLNSLIGFDDAWV